MLLAAACARPSAEGHEAPVSRARGLDAIRDTDTLRVLTSYSATSYFLYRGQPMGFEHDLVQRFAEALGVAVEWHLADNLDSVFAVLASGQVDLVAHGLTVTAERQRHVAFTRPLYETHQVLVQRKPDGWRRMSRDAVNRALVRDPIELIGDTVCVRAGTSYLERLGHLMDEVGGRIVIDTLPGTLTTGTIIRGVAEGRYPRTVADRNLAHIQAAAWPDLDIDTRISLEQRVAWAVDTGAPALLAAANAWIDSFRRETEYALLYHRYFENRGAFRRRVNHPLYSLSEHRISVWDELFRATAERHGLDWRWLAAVVCQESDFRPAANAWTGAAGLMQLMPATAEELGVADPTDPAASLAGGTRYLMAQYDRFPNVADSVQRLKLALAAYNCGFGHVRDAQRLAAAEGLDSLRWDGHVEEAMLWLSEPRYYRRPEVYYGYVRGLEPWTYVRQIFERYAHYRRLIPA